MGRRKRKTVMTGAHNGAFEVRAITIGQNLADHPTTANVETDRRLGMVDVLRPAFDDMRRDPIDKAAQLAR